MKKIYLLLSILLLSILLCFGFASSSEVHAQGGGPKPFEVGDVLPATTRLRISWNYTSVLSFHIHMYSNPIKTDSDNFSFTFGNPQPGEYGGFIVTDFQYPATVLYQVYYNNDDEKEWVSPYDTQQYCVIDISNLTLVQRTVSTASNSELTWEDLNAPTGYTITFNSHGGSTITDIEEATELPSELPIPTKTGYTFFGWYYDSDFTNEAFAGDPLTSDVTLYAKWELNTYTITYNSNGGSSIPQSSDATQLPNPLPIPTKSGYTFRGWYYDSDFTNEAFADDPLTTDVTLYAKWELNTYTITYNSNGGSSIPQSSDATQLPNPLPIPTKSGYTFFGWYYDSDFTNEAFADDPLTTDVTLYAKWELNTYTITYNSNGGSSIPQSSDATQLPNPLPIPTKSGYTFFGWYYDSDFTNEAFADDPLTTDVTLYAKWELNTYTITYNSNGGSSIPQSSDATQLPNPLPIPTKSGYTFRGWYYDSDFTNEAFADDPLTTDVTLYAKWELNTYTITYNSNGGSSIPQSSDATQLPNPLPIPTKSGYTFRGWYYDSDFTNEAFADDPLTTDVILYAMWGEKNKMTDITILIIGLIIFIIANILGFIYKNNLLTALSGLLWLLPIFLVDNAIIKIFSVIIMLITFLFSFKERDDYYYD